MDSTFNAFFSAITINQIIPTIYREVVYLQTSNYITALMAQPSVFTFFLTQYIHSSSCTCQHDASSSDSKCKCQKLIKCVSFLFLLDKHQFWFTTLVCVSSCHIPNVEDASKVTDLLWKLNTFVFCVCLAGHCLRWLLSPCHWNICCLDLQHIKSSSERKLFLNLLSSLQSNPIGRKWLGIIKFSLTLQGSDDFISFVTKH